MEKINISACVIFHQSSARYIFLLLLQVGKRYSFDFKSIGIERLIKLPRSQHAHNSKYPLKIIME